MAGPPEQEDFESDIEPVFSLQSEDQGTKPSAPENGIESIEEETPIILDPSDFEFETDPDNAIKEADIPYESIIDDIPTVPDAENHIEKRDEDDDLIELDLTGLDLKIGEPAVEPSSEMKTDTESVSEDTSEATESEEVDALPDGDIQMPESIRLELESKKEEIHSELDDTSQTPEHGLEQVEMDETLELDLDFADENLIVSPKDAIQDASGIEVPEPVSEAESPIDDLGIEAPEPAGEMETPIDDLGIEAPEPVGEMETPIDDLGIEAPEPVKEAGTPTDDFEIEKVDLEPAPSQDIRESDVLLPGMGPEGAEPDRDETLDIGVFGGDSEKVMAPPQFDLFEELPGEDWIEIEVNIEDGGYSTKDLDEFAPDLLLDEDSPKTPQSESTGATPDDTGPEALEGPIAGDGDGFSQTEDVAAEKQTRTAARRMEPTYHVPAPEPPKGLLSRRISLPLPLFAVLLILIGGTTYGMTTMFRPAAGPVDAGDTSIRLVDIESQFVQNQQVGNLLVITGRAINDYDHPRSFIRVAGKVYTSDRFVQSISVFCGSTLTKEELQNLPTADIVTQMLLRAGRNKSNMNISTGNAVPLMIVFPITSDLIDRLDSYTVEVVESKPS